MRTKRMLSLFLCFMLVLSICPLPAYAEDPPSEPPERRIEFKVWDGKAGSSILESVYSSGTYELYNSNNSSHQLIPVTVTSVSASVYLQIGASYDLKVTLPGYYSSNKHFEVTAGDNDWVDISLYQMGQIVHLGFDSVSVVVRTGDTQGLEVTPVSDKLGELSADQFTAALIPGTWWDVENDGLPVGMEEFPESVGDSRYLDAGPGDYVLFVSFFSEEVLVGYTTGTVNIPEEQPGQGEEPGEGEVKVTVEVRNEIESCPIGGALVHLSDGNNDSEDTTDGDGRVDFILVADCKYDVVVEKEGYYKANARFKAEDAAGGFPVALYEIDAIAEVGSSVIDVTVLETGSPGVDVGVVSEKLQEFYQGKLPDEFPDEFAVVLIRDSLWDIPWDIKTYGLPADLMEAPPEPLDRIRQESVHLDGDSEEVVVFAAFFRNVEEQDGEGHQWYRKVLSGYVVTRVVITQVQEGDDPHGPPPGDSGPLVFDYTLVDPGPEATGSVEINFDTRTDVFLVPMPASNAGTIVLPSTFDGKELTWTGMDDCFPFAEFSPDDFGGSFDGNVLSYTEPFKRIRLFAELEGEWRPYAFILCQPGYETFEIKFSLNGTEDYFVMEHDGTWEKRDQAFELPDGLALGSIEVTVNWQDSENQDDIGPIGGAIWEYLVDRSGYVVNDSDVLTFHRGFGKVTLHYGFQAGYSWEDAMVTFYEPDFVGIDVLPEIGAGDWHTGIVNASEASLSVMTPSAFVYFLNEKVFIRPSDVGRLIEIASVTSSEEGVESTQGELWFDPEAWAVTLPDITKPVTRLNLTVSFLDDGASRVVPLDIKRVLLDAFSLEFDGRDDLTPGETLWTPRMTEYEYRGEDFISFVGVFPFTETDQADPNYFEIDHTLLVNYYKDDILLGARQFEAYAGPDDFRHEIPVFRKGAPEYADVASANRIAAFLISKEGISSDDSTFGGAVFGIGAGWGHLMPNHAEYGSGKDGMDYE